MPEDTKKREEYAPITQRLREHLKVAALMQGYELSTPLAKGVLTECDNIDAIHKALEDANAEMQEFCNRLEDATKKHEDVTLWGTDYVALPLDADGVPVHVGDKMVWCSLYGNREIVRIVTGISNIDFFAYDADRHETVRCVSADYRHYHKPTVMDVLDELLMNWPDCEGPEDELALKQRCAERLRLADGDAE